MKIMADSETFVPITHTCSPGYRKRMAQGSIHILQKGIKEDMHAHCSTNGNNSMDEMGTAQHRAVVSGEC